MTDTFQSQTIDLSASVIQLIRTSLNNPKATFDATGIKIYDGNGNVILILNQTAGLSLTATPTGGPPSNPLNVNHVQWNHASASGGLIAEIEVDESATTTARMMMSCWTNADNNANRAYAPSLIELVSDTTLDANNQIWCRVYNAARTAYSTYRIIDATGNSDWLQTQKNLSDIPNVAAARNALLSGKLRVLAAGSFAAGTPINITSNGGILLHFLVLSGYRTTVGLTTTYMLRSGVTISQAVFYFNNTYMHMVCNPMVVTEQPAAGNYVITGSSDGTLVSESANDRYTYFGLELW